LPTLLTNEVASPSDVTINGSGQLYGTAGLPSQSNGVPSIAGPFTVGSGLPSNAGHAVNVLGTGLGANWPTGADVYGNLPTTNQIAVSPDGNTIFVADSRTDGLGGILEYHPSAANTWVLVGALQLDDFQISSASEPVLTASTPTAATWSGGIATITAANTFSAGMNVVVAGITGASGYDGTFTILSASPSSFTYILTPSPTGTPGFAAASAIVNSSATIAVSAPVDFQVGQTVSIGDGEYQLVLSGVPGVGEQHVRLLPADGRHERRRRRQHLGLLDAGRDVLACDERPGIPGSGRPRRRRHHRHLRCFGPGRQLPAHGPVPLPN
jgi:hypothetical protein